MVTQTCRTSMTVANAAAVIVARQNRWMRRFREAEALDPARAVAPGEVGIRPNWVFRRMCQRGVFVPTADGRYYMDAQAAERFVHDRRWRALTFAGVCLVAWIVIWALQTIARH